MLSNKCINGIKRLPIEERQEVYGEELFDRWCEISEKELEQVPEAKLRKILLDEFSGFRGIEEEIRTSTKQELIEQIIEGYDGSEKEFIDWIVNVYIDD